MSDRINYDDLRDEISCLNCGLVLAAPPQYVAGQIKVDMPWHYTFDNEVEWKTRKGVFTAWVGERQPDYK